MTALPTLLLALIVAGGVAVRLAYPPSYADWLDRDLQRAIALMSGEHIPLVGPELNSGGFLPGPFLYVLLSSALVFSHSPYAAVVLNWTLNIASIVIFALALVRRYSPFVVLTAVSLVTFAGLHVMFVGSAINPSFIFPLNALMVWFMLKIFVDGDDRWFYVALVTVALGSQLHLSFAGHAISLVVLMLLVRRPRLRVLAGAIALALVTLIPYGIHLWQVAGRPLYRAYQQFSPRPPLLSYTFRRIFLSPSTEKVTGDWGAIDPSSLSPLELWGLGSYLLVTRRFELLTFATALVVAVVLLVRRRRDRSRDTLHVLVPCLAALPIIVTWEVAGFSAHAHWWYGFIFFPLVPWWIAACLGWALSFTRGRWQPALKVAVVVATLALAPRALLYPVSSFGLLDSIVADVRDVAQRLELSPARYREDIYFLAGGSSPLQPSRHDPPFAPGMPHGTYSDYMYSTMTADLPRRRESAGDCWLIGHRVHIDVYSLEFYLKNIQERFGVRPTSIDTSDRLVYFAYRRPADGNCFHNTLNAFVVNERLHRVFARIPSGEEHTLVGDVRRSPAERTLRFAVLDRSVHLPMIVEVTFARSGADTRWTAALHSAQLMGALNHYIGYSGLFRPWAFLSIDDVRLVIQSPAGESTLRIGGGAIGRERYTPITVSERLGGADFPLDGPVTLTLRYRSTTAGTYTGGGADIQVLYQATAPTEREANMVLYRGPALPRSN